VKPAHSQRGDFRSWYFRGRLWTDSIRRASSANLTETDRPEGGLSGYSAQAKADSLRRRQARKPMPAKPALMALIDDPQLRIERHLRAALCWHSVKVTLPLLLRVSDAGRSQRCGLHRGRRPKAAKERTRGGWGAENAAHCAMGIWLMRKV
jgi:hypothetical protein